MKERRRYIRENRRASLESSRIESRIESRASTYTQNLFSYTRYAIRSHSKVFLYIAYMKRTSLVAIINGTLRNETDSTWAKARRHGARATPRIRRRNHNFVLT